MLLPMVATDTDGTGLCSRVLKRKRGKEKKVFPLLYCSVTQCCLAWGYFVD